MIYFLLILGTVISSISSAVYRRKTYMNYTPFSNLLPENTDFHNIEIIYSTADIAARTDTPSDWKYSIRFMDSTVQGVSTYNNDLIYNRYSSYMLNNDATHSSKNYVAWNDALPICANAQLKVTYKIKFFTCEVAAINFYNYLLSISTPNVVAVDTSGDILFENSDIGEKLSDLLGKSTAYVSTCT